MRFLQQFVVRNSSILCDEASRHFALPCRTLFRIWSRSSTSSSTTSTTSIFTSSQLVSLRTKFTEDNVVHDSPLLFSSSSSSSFPHTNLSFSSNDHRIRYFLNRKLVTFRQFRTAPSSTRLHRLPFSDVSRTQITRGSLKTVSGRSISSSSVSWSSLSATDGDIFSSSSRRQFHSSAPTWRRTYKGTVYVHKAPVAEVGDFGVVPSTWLFTLNCFHN